MRSTVELNTVPLGPKVAAAMEQPAHTGHRGDTTAIG